MSKEIKTAADLKQDGNNYRKHSDTNKARIKKSIDEAGLGRSVVIDADGVLIAGNGVQQVVDKDTPVKVVETDGTELVVVKRTDLHTGDPRRKTLALADNATADDVEWDFEAIAEDWTEDEAGEWGVEWPADDEECEQKQAQEDDFDPDKPVETVCKKGDIWKLGNHRLMCGDSTDADAVAKLMNGERADLVFTDPPYGMKKESEGVLNDNLNFDDLLEFNKRWIPLTFANLKDNGSWYCWGIDEPLMDIYSNILRPMQKRNEITFRNLITWDKGDAGAGGVSFIGKDGLRSYPISDEKCLFVMCGKEGYNINADNYFEGWEPIRLYLEGEAQSVGLDNKKVTEICGVGMYSHWFSKSQWGFIPQKHYDKLQAYYNGKAFTKSYEELDAEFKRIKQEWYATRAYFDNTHDNMTTVWHFNRTKGEERAECGDHATPKPLALCARGIKTSSREGEIVLDVFGGSGSTMIACEQLGRKCRMMELDPHYCDVIIARWEKLTGNKAEKLK